MSQVADASFGGAPSSPQLKATVERAYGYADEQAHRQVTPEHLLLALTEDADSVAVLERKGIDLDRLRNDVAGLMSRNNDRFAPGETGNPDYSADFRRVMNIASGAASPRRPVDGALMLSALIADGVTPSAELIKLYGLTFEDASRTSRPLRSPPPAPPTLATVRSTAREAALGYRLRKGPPDDFVALTATNPASSNGQPRRYAEPPVQQARTEQSAPSAAPVAPQTDEWDNDYAEPPPVQQQHVAPEQGAAPAWQPANTPDSHAQPEWTQTGLPQSDDPDYLVQEPTYAEPAPRQPQRASQRLDRQPEDRRTGDAAAAAKSRGRKSTGRSRRAPTESGLLLENIPRRMVRGIAMAIEARIARRDVEAAILDLRVLDQLQSIDADVTHAVTVRLRSPDGAMIVEPGSPETQWVENTLGLLQDDFSSWRWTVTPRWSGTTRLQLVVSTRAVTPQGLLGDMALPEQSVGVTVVANYGSVLGSVAKWIGIALAAGIVGAVGEHMLKVVGGILTH